MKTDTRMTLLKTIIILLLSALLQPTQSFTPPTGRTCFARNTDRTSLHETKSDEKQEDRLLDLLSFIDKRIEGRNMACGLEATEKEQDLVKNVAKEVEDDEKHNLVLQKQGKITFSDLEGDWTLMYTNSRTIGINKSLSGLGRSQSEHSNLLGLVQKLGGTKYIGTVEFLEEFGNLETREALLTVKIDGEWFTKFGNNVYTGQPMTSIEIVPSKVKWAMQTNNAADWSSLGPIKILDVSYLSSDMMISRVNVYPDGFFVWKRI